MGVFDCLGAPFASLGNTLLRAEAAIVHGQSFLFQIQV